ncbi:MAG: iron-containing alcohol dehydrogenase, partial [Bermanella sp.]
MQQALPNSHWHYPTSIYFGNGRIHMLAGLCEQMKMHNPLLVTDEGLATFAFIKDLQASLNNAPIYSAIKANPNGKNIEDGVGVYRQGRHDGIVAVGGGSALDAAKAMALMVGQARSLWDFEDVGDNYLRVKVEAMAQVIAIPTTAGTGSEVGRAALIVDEDSQRKRILFHPNMLPSQVILDPELTLGLPPAITSATGLDAFVHNLEAYLAPGFHPMADGIAL